jgi:hypothetical protein
MGARHGGLQQQPQRVPSSAQAQQQQQLLLESQMGLSGLGFQGWAQPAQPTAAAAAAGFGSFLEGDRRLAQAGCPVGQEQVLQWLMAQQQAGIARMDTGMGMAGGRQVAEAPWWGNVQEVPRVNMY